MSDAKPKRGSVGERVSTYSFIFFFFKVSYRNYMTNFSENFFLRQEDVFKASLDWCSTCFRSPNVKTKGIKVSANFRLCK